MVTKNKTANKSIATNKISTVETLPTVETKQAAIDYQFKARLTTGKLYLSIFGDFNPKDKTYRSLYVIESIESGMFELKQFKIDHDSLANNGKMIARFSFDLESGLIVSQSKILLESLDRILSRFYRDNQYDKNVDQLGSNKDYFFLFLLSVMSSLDGLKTDDRLFSTKYRDLTHDDYKNTLSNFALTFPSLSFAVTAIDKNLKNLGIK